MTLHSLHRMPGLATRQRGAAALAVALLLLFSMTVIAFFANRNMIFEQRTSANQYRSTRAFETAEAGLEWAVAQLNQEGALATAPSCAAAAGTGSSFADRYVPITSAGFRFTSGLTYRAACRIGANNVVNCVCPAAVATPSVALSADAEPRFVVDFQAGPDDWSVRIVSRGCTNAGAHCFDGGGSPDGAAVVTALYKMRPRFPGAPGAGLVTGTAANTGGNLTVINKDPASNGITINSGSVVDLGGSTSAITIDGSPARASVLDNDPALRNLTNADANGELFFRTFFNEGFTQYQESSRTWLITSGSCAGQPRCTQCASANACGQAITDAYANNYEKFWADTPITLSTSNGTTFGSAARPLSIASSSSLEFRGAVTAYGAFYSASGTADENYVVPGTGAATVYGAIVVRGSFVKGTGDLRLVYDANLFAPSTNRDQMIRVPGSWRDTLGEL